MQRGNEMCSKSKINNRFRPLVALSVGGEGGERYGTRIFKMKEKNNFFWELLVLTVLTRSSNAYIKCYEKNFFNLELTFWYFASICL